MIFVDTNVLMYAVGSDHPLVGRFPGRGARALLHVACCQRRDFGEIKMFDRVLAAAFAHR